MASTELREHVQRLLFYDRWANASLLETMHQMEDPPEHAIERMNHIIAAIQLWGARCAGLPNPDTDLFHPGWSLDESVRRHALAYDTWAAILAPLDDNGLRRRVCWTRYEGGDYQALLRDIVTQLPLHAAYHRGQLSLMLKAKLRGPLDLDYIFTTWQSAEAEPV